MSQLKLFLLGAPRLERDSAALEFDTRKAIALAAYLAMGGQSYSRDTLAALLWPEYDQSQARGNLRRTLSVLVKGIGAGQMVVDRETIGLAQGNGLWVDAVLFQQLLTECDNHDHTRKAVGADCLPLLNQALALYQGDFMAGFNLRDSSEEFEAWHRFQSESLRQAVAGILEKLVNGYLAQGEFEQAISHARRWVALDPLDEAAHRQMMQVYAWAGQRSAALRQYQNLARILDAELGIPPDEETAALHRAIEDNCLIPPSIEPVNETSSSPLPSSSLAPALNLPAQATSFIGRATELAELTRLLAEPNCRLLTLTGPGGVGKTRLAIELARGQQQAFANGIHFVSLAPVGETEFIVPSVAEALHFSLSGSAPPSTQLINYLRHKQLLLVLDNMEHLLPHAGDNEATTVDLLADILRNAAAVKLLATSRERLNIHGEWVFEMHGLSVPPIGQLDRLESYDAVALFVESARRASAAFALTENEQPAIIRICQLVEGMPLGIELAAAWVHLLSCTEIAREIERNLDILTTSARDVPERQRSLRAAFDHSWNLLSQDERRVLRQLSVFRGGFRREAAEQVMEATLPLLSTLVDKSFLRRTATGRYHIHELLRQFAATHLSENPPEELAAGSRHSAFYLNLLKTHEMALFSRGQKEALTELNADIDNIRAAWDAAVGHEEMDRLRQAAFPLWYFYNLRDTLQEGESAFGQAAEMVRARLAATDPDQTGVPERARLAGALGELLSHQAQFTFRQGRRDTAAALYQTSLALLRPLDEPGALAQALTYCGVVCWIGGEFDRAWPYLNEAISIFSELGDEWLQAQCHTFMGMVAHMQGDYAGAYSYLSDSMSRARALGDPRLMSLIAGQLSRAAQALGRTSEVLELLRECLHLTTETGDRLGLGITLEQMAVVTQATGDEVKARSLLQESIDQFREIGDTWFLAHALNLAGDFALTAGEETQAHESFRQAGQIAVAAQAPPNILDALAGVARLYARQGQSDRALELATHILQHPASTQEAKDRAERLRRELENRLTPQQLTSVQARGESRTLETFVAETLQL